MNIKQTFQLISEDFDSLDEALSNIERIKRSRKMQMKKNVLKRKREIAMRKPLTQNKVKKRSKLRAKNALIRKYTKGRSKSELSFGERTRIERRLKKKKAVIDRMARRIAKDVRKGN